MAKLKFAKEFTIEVGEIVYSGTLKELTKLDKKKLNKLADEKKKQTKKSFILNKEINKIKRKIEIAEKQDKWDVVEKFDEKLDKLEAQGESLVEELENDTEIEELFKQRLEISVVSDNLTEILALGEEYTYQEVFNTIIKSIDEIEKGN